MEQRPSQADPERLESWKAIANYFNRSVRTMHRWEKHEGLPVHRHRHSKGSTVYAYRDELNAWQQRHHDRIDSSNTDLSHEPERRTRETNKNLSSRSLSTAACAVIMFAAAGAAALISWTVRDTIEPGSKPNEDCMPCRGRLAKLRVDHFENNLQAAWALAESGWTKQAALYSTRALDLVPSQDAELSPRSTARALVFPVIRAWLDGELATAVTESQRLQDQLSQWPRNVQDLIAQDLGAVALALGRLDQAETLFDLVSNPSRRYELRALALFARLDSDQLHKHLESGSEFSGPHIVHWLFEMHPGKNRRTRPPLSCMDPNRLVSLKINATDKEISK